MLKGRYVTRIGDSSFLAPGSRPIGHTGNMIGTLVPWNAGYCGLCIYLLAIDIGLEIGNKIGNIDHKKRH
jgi:hypothetical protein